MLALGLRVSFAQIMGEVLNFHKGGRIHSFEMQKNIAGLVFKIQLPIYYILAFVGVCALVSKLKLSVEITYSCLRCNFGEIILFVNEAHSAFCISRRVYSDFKCKSQKYSCKLSNWEMANQYSRVKSLDLILQLRAKY